MDTSAIVALIIQIADALIKYGPTFLEGAEQVYENLKLAYQSATSGQPLTADEEAQYDAALTAADALVTERIAARKALETPPA